VAPPARPTGPDGTISLVGNIPQGARITANSSVIGARQKLPPGRYTIRIQASGFRPYEARVDVASTATVVHAVTLQPAQVATAPTGTQPPGTATPQSTPGAPAANCAQPGPGRLNANNACYDTPPIARTPLVLPAPESCTDPVGPVTVTFRVSATGDVETASASARSNCAAFTDQAVAFARDLAFTPAVKGGQAVAAWIARLVRPQPR